MVLAFAGDSTITTFIQEISFGSRRRIPFAPGRSGAGYGDAGAACQITRRRERRCSSRALDVRLREIVALVKKRGAADLGLSVDETVPKVEPRPASSCLAVAS